MDSKKIRNKIFTLLKFEDNMSTIKCKPTQPYIERSLSGDFTWHVYNEKTGRIVASTYNEEMAGTILFAILECGYYRDEYAITESWKSPEPLV
jgi:hypothetical protein